MFQQFLQLAAVIEEALNKPDAGIAANKLGELRQVFKQLTASEKEVALPLAQRLAQREVALARLTQAHPEVAQTSSPLPSTSPEAPSEDWFDFNDNGQSSQPEPSPESSYTDEQLLTCLHKLGYDSFRPGQKEIIEAVLSGRDTMAIMPTGGGKSLCYQLPSMLFDKHVVVVTPLIALMQDQTQRMADHGAVMLSSNQSEEENRSALSQISRGQAKVIFVAPERFSTGVFMDILRQHPPSLFVIDEAHCLAEQGHDFRPDYLRLTKILDELNNPPVLALTATATQAIATEVMDRLRLRNPFVHWGGFNRVNLSFDVLPFAGKGSMTAKEDILLAGIVREDMQPAIVYAGTRKEVEQVQQLLETNGVGSAYYHAGLEASERKRRQRDFMNGNVNVLVATTAFGLGLDKADIRSVWHWSLPNSLEGYYQEAGRAGRDGKPSRAILLSQRKDLGRLIYFSKQRELSVEMVNAFLNKLWQSRDRQGKFQIALNEDNERRIFGILERVGVVNILPSGGGLVAGVVASKNLDVSERQMVKAAIDKSMKMGWEAFHSVERFSAKHDTCRRQLLLAHFGDRIGDEELLVRCCDVCEPPKWKSEATASATTIRKKRTVSKKTAASAPAPGRIEGFALSSPEVVKPKKKGTTKLDEIASDVDQELLSLLTEWRRKRSQGRPAYTVCTNSALAEVARTRPATANELLAINGIGKVFITKHSGDLLKLLGNYSQGVK